MRLNHCLQYQTTRCVSYTMYSIICDEQCVLYVYTIHGGTTVNGRIVQGSVDNVFRFTTFCVQFVCYVSQFVLTLLPEPRYANRRYTLLQDDGNEVWVLCLCVCVCVLHTYVCVSCECVSVCQSVCLWMCEPFVSLSLYLCRENRVQNWRQHFSLRSPGGGSMGIHYVHTYMYVVYVHLRPTQFYST